MKKTTATGRPFVGSGSVAAMVLTALMAAILCVVGPLSIPIGPVPISLLTLVLYLSVYILGTGRATLACMLYLMLGLVGLPVFTEYQGGIGKLAGPTGGYLIGYIPLVLISGCIVGWLESRVKKEPESGKKNSRGSSIMLRVLQAFGLIVATAILYTFGTAWFVVSTGTPTGAALTICVIPFLPGDAIKIVCAVIIGPGIRQLIRRSYT